MMNIMKKILCGFLTLATMSITETFGQTTSHNFIDELVVTGSRTFQRSALESPHPVDSLSNIAITNTAYGELGSALQALIPSINYPSTSIADGTDTLKPATLRGLGPDQTLVLVNGIRRHKSALLHINSSVGRGTAGTDMAAIPSSFVQTIEILRDGASAQYGSDAIAGVINIKLKEQTPAENILSYGKTTQGDGEKKRLAMNNSFTLPHNGFLFMGYEYRQQDKTNRSDPSGSILYSGEAGISDPETCNATTNTGCDPREFTANRRHFIVGDPKSKQHAIVINTGIDIGQITMQTSVIWSERENQSTGFFREPDDPTRNIVAVYPDGFLPQINTNIDDLSWTINANTILNDWDIDAHYSQGYNVFDFYITNSLNASFGANSPTEADAGGLKYKEKIFNLNVSKDIHDISMASGFEWKNETYNIRAGDPISYLNCNTDANAEIRTGISGCVEGKTGGIQVFPGFKPTNELSRNRDSYSVFLEASYEWQNMLTNVAIRWEDYDGFGNILAGKLSLFNKINDQHALRGTISNGFRAPSMHQLHFNNVSTQFLGDEASQTGTFTNDSQIAQGLGIPTLTEETSMNYSIGYIYTPHNNFSMTIDAYQIDIDDRIILSGQIRRDNMMLAAEASRIMDENEVTAAQFLINGPDTQTRGVEFVALWSPEVPKGELDIKLTTSYIGTQVKPSFKVPYLLEGIENAIFSPQDLAIIESWQPKGRIILETNYSIGDFTFTGLFNRYDRYIGSENLSSGYVSQKFDPAFVTDLRIHWQPNDSVTVTLIGNNIFDNYPEEDSISSTRGGTILDIIESDSVFKYSRRTAPYGFNGAFWGIQFKTTL